MPLAGKQDGATLLELLITVVIVIVVVTSISLLIPKASAGITNDRHRWLASSLAASRIQDMKQQHYAQIPLTPASVNYFSSVATTAGGCDCSGVNWTQLKAAVAPDVDIEDGVTYRLQVCTDLVNRNTTGTWDSYCPNNPPPVMSDPVTGPDFGLKSIRVRVSWTYAGDAYSYDTESIVTR
jgi:Tfp pilus assembly protein PilV